ncbi:hypothetical protein F5Y06DRAFT_296605 [Hypoxylon sp. FL0890]|nr:hypothetical protein F5Y06DRAFT_296605 [Hypoxylon sp. FL0890]
MQPNRILFLLPFTSAAGAHSDRSDDSLLNVTRTVEVEVTTTVFTTTVIGAAIHYKFLSGSPPSTSTATAPASKTTICTRRSVIFEVTTLEFSEPSIIVTSETKTVTETLKSATTRRAMTQTVYPCANMTNFQGPAYGDANILTPLAQSNSLYGLNDTSGHGVSAEACCNACYFAVSNCIQAYWYFYEGCVVSVATNLTDTWGENESSACPSGTFEGLTYGPDAKPAFRSTGNIAGPCGRDYTNILG